MFCAAIVWAAPATVPTAFRVPVRQASDGDAPVRNSFSIDLNGKPGSIAGVLTPDDAQMLLIVLDLTGDVAQADPAKQALIEAVGKLPASTWVALLRAQDGLSVLCDPTSDRTTVQDAIRGLSVSGRPGLIEVLDGVQRLADSIARKSRVRVSAVYITDSDVTAYREDFTNPVINSSDPHDLSRRFPEQLIQEKIAKLGSTLAARQTSLHLVHVANRTDRLNEAYENGLRRLAEDSGGISEFCRTTAEIPAAIQRAIDAASKEYSLLVAVPEKGPPSGQVQVAAKDAAGNSVPLVFKTRVAWKEKQK
jgi:hypothetical protein